MTRARARHIVNVIACMCVAVAAAAVVVGMVTSNRTACAYGVIGLSVSMIVFIPTADWVDRDHHDPPAVWDGQFGTQKFEGAPPAAGRFRDMIDDVGPWPPDKWIPFTGHHVFVESVVHRCPTPGTNTTVCCHRTPFDLPWTDRLTIIDELVTCDGAA